MTYSLFRHSWSALDAKRERDKFAETEDKMLALLKRDYGLTDTDGELKQNYDLKQFNSFYN